MNEPQIPTPGQLWLRYEELILEVLTEALFSLRNQPILPTEEPAINLEFYFRIRRVSLDLTRSGRGMIPSVIYEGRNQPIEGETINDKRIKKVPDFQWPIIDDSQTDTSKAYKIFVIECKRLGKPTINKWIFNKNYINHGVIRYISEDWGYGKDTISGAMIGYIQNMTPNDILIEVNYCAAESGISAINLSAAGWKNNDVSRLDQLLDRPNVPPTHFNLRHLWIDLRDKYAS